MSQPAPSASASPRERFRERFGPRARAVALALLIEILLALLLLTIAPTILREEKEPVSMTTFGISPEPEPITEEKAPAPSAAANPARAQPTETPPDPEPPAPQPPVPQPEPPAMLDIPLSKMPDLAALPRSAAPAAPRRPAAGPPNLASLPGDTPRVEGRGPSGEPLYAASWYREPYDSELRGYLSTARGPGWALIACRTVPDFRVEDCVKVDEYPDGSNLARAVLAAAWQFRVRPPRLGGQSKVGEWVRIRIDYEIRRQPQPQP